VRFSTGSREPIWVPQRGAMRQISAVEPEDFLRNLRVGYAGTYLRRTR
jgi:hypothetical protein